MYGNLNDAERLATCRYTLAVNMAQLRDKPALLLFSSSASDGKEE